MSFKDLSPSERITAVNFDIMRDPEFSLLGGVTQIGKIVIDPNCQTAATDGRDCIYGEKFIMGMTRRQLRYLVCHENYHKALHHLVEYKSICDKYPGLSNQAMDYAINGLIEEADAGRGWVARPVDPAPLIDPKYKDHSWLDILKDLLKEQEKQKKEGRGQDGAGQPGTDSGHPGGTLDEHAQSTPGSGEPGAMTEAEGKELAKQVQDAINQGAIVRDKLRGQGKGGRSLSGFQERRTDWKTPLRKFVQEHCEGDDQSRFSPPNRRMLPLSVILPSHFSEATGALLVAVDMSGSMGAVVGTLLGEIARICQQCQPEAVHVVFWDSEICNAQKFTSKDYAGIAKLLKPKGGGGTTLSVVADWVEEKKLRPRATIILTDTYFESNPRLPPGPILWGVVDRAGWTPPRGKKIDIDSMQL